MKGAFILVSAVVSARGFRFTVAMVAPAAAVLGLAGFAAAQSHEAPARPPLFESACVAIAALEPLEIRQPAPTPPPSREAGAESDLERPISAGDVELLIRAMEPIPLKEGQGRAIRAVAEPISLAPERMRVLLGDATALLAELHARETADRLKQARSLQRAARGQVERSLEAMRSCARARFAQRGGDPAFQESLQVVEKNRTALESMLLRREGLK